MDERKRLVKNTGIIAIGNFSTKLVQFLLLPLYTSLLTTSEYGITDYIIAISTFCVPFISVLMDESMFRFLIDCKTEKQRSQVISISTLIILCGGAVFLLLAIPILYFTKYEYSIYVLLYILSSTATVVLSALLRGLGRTDYYAIFNFITSATKIILNVIFIALFHWGAKGMLLASILAQSIIPIIYVLKLNIIKYIDFSFFDRQQAITMIKYSVPLIPNKLSWSIISLSSRIIIMQYLGSAASGIYAVSQKFPNMMDTIYGFFYQSWKESSARVVEGERKDDFYNYIYKYLKRFMFAIVVGMTAFMPLIFKILIGNDYYEAILYVPFLLLATYFSNMSGFYGGIFTAYKDTNIMGITTVVAAAINLLTMFVLINYLEIYAAAVATLLANVVVYQYRKIKVRKYVYLEESITDQVLSILVFMIIVILFYMQKNYLNTICCIIAVLYATFTNKEMLNNAASLVVKKFGTK